MNALAGGEYKQRLRAVDSITGGCLLRAWLQKCAFRQRFAARAAQYGENRTDRDIHIDIGGTVERVAQQQICALCAAVRDEMNLRHFFGRDCCERAAGRCFFKQNLIGDQVQFLLDFALYIFLPSAAKRATERALIHLGSNGSASIRNGFNQLLQTGVRSALCAPRFREELAESEVHCGNLSGISHRRAGGLVLIKSVFVVLAAVRGGVYSIRGFSEKRSARSIQACQKFCVSRQWSLCILAHEAK